MILLQKSLMLVLALQLATVLIAQGYILRPTDVIWKAGKPLANVEHNIEALLQLEFEMTTLYSL